MRTDVNRLLFPFLFLCQVETGRLLRSEAGNLARHLPDRVLPPSSVKE